MKKDIFSKVFNEKGWLLADGAMGTSLFAMGLTSGDAPELWNKIHGERIAGVHDAFIAAGSDIILTNSFGANRLRLKLHEAQDQTAALNEMAAGIARQSAARAGRPVFVAGSMGPTGEIFAPVGALSHEEGVAVFTEQAEALKRGGVDLLWVETLSSKEEMGAALQACARTGLPVAMTLSFDTNGCTMMGLTPEEFVSLAVSVTMAAPVAVGANCGVGAADLVATVLRMARANPQATLIAKANCGVPSFVEGKIRYSGTPELMADYAWLARDAGAHIIGGCCGTTPDHLSAMRKALETRAKGPPPELGEITARLGDVSSPVEEKAGERGAARRTRRPRRASRQNRAVAKILPEKKI